MSKLSLSICEFACLLLFPLVRPTEKLLLNGSW